MNRSLVNRKGAPEGQSLVEFALVLPLILLLIMGVVDLGRGIFAYNTLAESARQANRLAIVDQDVARVRDVAVAHAPGLGLAAANIDVCFKKAGSPERSCANNTDECGSSTSRQLGCLAIVTSRATFSAVTPIISAVVPTISLASTSVGTIENSCPRSGKSTCP